MRSRIEKRDGFVYEKVGSKKGFETYYFLGKDPDDPRWQPKAKPVEKPKKAEKKIVENVVENEKEPVE